MRDPHPSDVESVIDTGKVGRYQARIVVLCGLVIMIDGFDTQAIAFVAPEIARLWGAPIASFGPVFGAGLFGGMLGALGFGAASDRYGRKPGLLISIAIFGIGSLLTPFATSMGQLLVLRVVTGIGLGGAMPNVIALTSEYAPKRIRATLITSMFCGFPLGAAIGGAVSAWSIPRFGWQSVLVAGGLLPIVLLPFVVRMIPESIRFLIARGNLVSAQRILERLTTATVDLAVPAADQGPPRSGVANLFREGRLPGTLLLWSTFFLSLLMTFFLINWIPSVTRQAGLDLRSAVVAVALLNVGSILGVLFLGRLIDRFGPYGVIASSYVVGSVAIAAIGHLSASTAAVLVAAFVAGFFSIGAQMSVVALAAGYYSTLLRATGVGWSMGVGRIGGIIGPVTGGLLVAAGFGGTGLFLFAAAASLLAAASILAMRMLAGSRSMV